MEAYCFKCRTKREMTEEKPVTMKNGKPATEGKCPTCGTRMFKIGSAGAAAPGTSTGANKSTKAGAAESHGSASGKGAGTSAPGKSSSRGRTSQATSKK